MKRLVYLLLVLMLIAVPLPKISRAADTSSVTMAFIESEPDTLDPQAAAAVDDFQVLWNVYDGLVGYDSKTLAVDNSGLAEKWDISDDGLVYTFHLRKG